MATTVINIKDAPAGWHETWPYMYIGRAGKGLSGRWGNPFVLRHNTRTNILEKYRAWFYAPQQEAFRTQAFIDLKDRILVCFCKPELCHGDVIANYVDNEHENM